MGTRTANRRARRVVSARDWFSAGSGLVEYVQFVVIINVMLTKYDSHTTRRQHISKAASTSKRGKQTSTPSCSLRAGGCDG